MRVAELDEASLFSILAADGLLREHTDGAFADAARRGGAHLACRAGCNACCHGAFRISALDALRLRAGLSALEEKQPAVGAEIRSRAAKYRLEFGSGFPGDASTGLLDPERAEEFEEFANEAACPVLDPQTGLCDLYEARPMTCRVFGPPVRQGVEQDEEEGFAVCELCFTEASEAEIVAAEMHPPVDEEARLLAAVASAGAERAVGGETIVAWCL